MELEPLSGDESSALIEHLIGDAGVAARSPDRVFARAEGNPLFVEELVRMLVDERHIEQDDSGLSSVRSSPLSVPPTIHALLAARLDRLDPAERAVRRGRARCRQVVRRRRRARAGRGDDRRARRAS